MRVLHFVKTSEGATWAALQARELCRLGVEVHVVVPQPQGRGVAAWREAGAVVHTLACDLPVRRPWRMPAVCRAVRELVQRVSPDLVHSHFFGTTLVVRKALGSSSSLPRIFQVPGPLHLEHALFRNWDLWTAGGNDHWIASSRCIQRRYIAAGVAGRRVFLSYYGIETESFSTERTGRLRSRLDIANDALMVGNINYMYPPKYYLGQRIGLKAHEVLIDALAIALREQPRLVGVLAGGQFGKGDWYEQRLWRRAHAAAGDRLMLPGYLSPSEVRDGWGDFDLVVHVPLSENCGGVLEPMLSGVPVLAAAVGGLPELVIDGVTGVIARDVRPAALARQLLETLDHLDALRRRAPQARQLVREMFDVRRTAAEVHAIYRHLLDPTSPRPAEYLPNVAPDNAAVACL
ncbi:MAG: glycosyltransferase family 4 protein [Planctomycetes bacterium]|nr:glycosyltransferase family 4 protein [Planctomycetota bacterium]